MVFSCAPNFRAKASAKKQALKQKLAGAGAYHGVSLRLLLVDRQVDEQDVLPHAALSSVHVVKYDAHTTTLAELVGLIREAHRQNTAPFLSMAVAQHGADEHGQWAWTSDLTVNLKNMHGAIDQLAPVVEVLAAALSKTKAGKAHIDLLACNLATTCKGLIPALEKMYGIDFRASTDETGNDLSGGDWKMETDNDYDVAADYLDAIKLKDYAETMAGTKKGRRELAKTLAAVPIGIAYTEQFDEDMTKAELAKKAEKQFDEDFRDWMIKQGGFTQAMRAAACMARRGIRKLIGKTSPLTEEHLKKCLAAAKKAGLAAAKKARPEEVAPGMAYGPTMTKAHRGKTATDVPPTLADPTPKAGVPACSGGCAHAPRSCPNAHGANPHSDSYKTSDIKSCIKLDHTSARVQTWLSQYRFMHIVDSKYDHACVNVSGWAQLVTEPTANPPVLAPVVCYYMIGKDAPPLSGMLKGQYAAGATHFTWEELLAVAPEAEQHVWFRNCSNSNNYEVQLSWSSPIVSN